MSQLYQSNHRTVCLTTDPRSLENVPHVLENVQRNVLLGKLSLGAKTGTTSAPSHKQKLCNVPRHVPRCFLGPLSMAFRPRREGCKGLPLHTPHFPLDTLPSLSLSEIPASLLSTSTRPVIANTARTSRGRCLIRDACLRARSVGDSQNPCGISRYQTLTGVYLLSLVSRDTRLPTTDTGEETHNPPAADPPTADRTAADGENATAAADGISAVTAMGVESQGEESSPQTSAGPSGFSQTNVCPLLSGSSGLDSSVTLPQIHHERGDSPI